MAKVRFEYDEYEERQEIMRVLRATDMALALSDICEHYRQKAKYSDDPQDVISAACVREVISQLMQNRNIYLDDLL